LGNALVGSAKMMEAAKENFLTKRTEGRKKEGHHQVTHGQRYLRASKPKVYGH